METAGGRRDATGPQRMGRILFSNFCTYCIRLLVIGKTQEDKNYFAGRVFDFFRRRVYIKNVEKLLKLKLQCLKDCRVICKQTEAIKTF